MNHNLVIGKTFQNYRITDYIKSGGMGSVYRAEHDIIHTPAVIKILHPQFMTDENVRLRFEQEAKILAKLQHPNIVRLLNYDKTDDGLIIVMDLVQGKTLADLLREHPHGMALKQVNRILIPLLDALFYAHERGVVHRDLKPNNIMVQPNGEPVLLDFGIAKFAEAEMTQFSQVMGTPVYMSPEQILDPRNIDFKSDIYTCGVLLFQLSSGTLPYDPNSSPFHIQQKIVQEPLPKLPGVPESINNIIQKATFKSIEQRFSSAKEMRDALFMEDATEPDFSTKVPRVTFAKAIFIDDDADNPLESDNTSKTEQGKLERLEAERKAKEEADRIVSLEAERKAKEEADRIARLEAERKAKEEADRIAKLEAERKAKEEADRIARLEAERKAKEEADRIARLEAERKAKEEADRIARLEAERKAKEEADRIARLEADRKAKEEAERLVRLEADRKTKEAQERLAKLEAEHKLKEEQEKKQQAEIENRIRDDYDRLLKTEIEHKKKTRYDSEDTTQIQPKPQTSASSNSQTVIMEQKRQVVDTPSVSTASEPKKANSMMRLWIGAGIVGILIGVALFAFGGPTGEPPKTVQEPPVVVPNKPVVVTPPPPPRDYEGEDFAQAEQTATIPSWKTFIEKYPKGKKTDEAKAALGELNNQVKDLLNDATRTEVGGLKAPAKTLLEKALKLDSTNESIKKRLEKLK